MLWGASEPLAIPTGGRGRKGRGEEGKEGGKGGEEGRRGGGREERPVERKGETDMAPE